MMYNSRYINRLIALAIIVSGVLVSCSDDFFDSKPGGRITPEQHYKSYDDVVLSYLGCYSIIQDIAENQVLVDGLRSDLMSTTENANSDMIAIENHDLSSFNQYIDPSNYYKIVVNVNEVLPNLEKVFEIDRDFDSLAMVTYQGALITLRSWAYFNLARINGEVAFINETDPTKAPEYLSKIEAITKLIKELKQFYDEEDLLRFDIDHYVLLGEMLLEKGNYTDAVKYLKFAVDGPYFPARDGYYMVTGDYGIENWRNIFINSSQQGFTVRTAIPYSFEQQTRNMLEEWFYYGYMVKPSSTIISAFEGETLRTGEPGDLYRGPGSSYDSVRNEFDELEYYIYKYSIDTDVAHGADVILYRAADMHLLLAEALNRAGQGDLALTLLNRGFGALTGAERPEEYSTWSKNKGVRGRAYLADVTAESVEAIEDLIIEERYKELAFEGKRWFDLIRIAERRNDPAYLADRVASKFEDPDKAEQIRSKLMSTSNWYIPIPR